VLVQDFFLRPASFLPANFYSSICYTCSNFTVSSDLILSTSDLATALVSMKHETTNDSFASRYFQSGLFCKQDPFHDFKIKLMIFTFFLHSPWVEDALFGGENLCNKKRITTHYAIYIMNKNTKLMKGSIIHLILKKKKFQNISFIHIEIYYIHVQNILRST